MIITTKKRIHKYIELRSREIWAREKYFYDSYFYYKGKQYIIEMDGGFHYDQVFGYQTPEIVNERDRIKDNLAKEHNITLIRIDCRKSEIAYIKNEILHSHLANIFDLSCIDWEKCHKEALKSNIRNAYDLYLKGFSIPEISNNLKCSDSTIRNYLKLCSELHWCIYPKPKNKIKVFSKDKKDIVGLFNDINECITYMNNNFTNNFYKHQIYAVCSQKNRKTYNGFIFEYA